MVKEIVKDVELLQKKCIKVNNIADDLYIIQDLIDTAEFHKSNCLGLAANQIGYHKRIVIIKDGDGWLPLINPAIFYRSTGRHDSEEGCLSLEGTRMVARHNRVSVMYQNKRGKWIKLQLKGLAADVIQHETDHLEGILI